MIRSRPMPLPSRHRVASLAATTALMTAFGHPARAQTPSDADYPKPAASASSPTSPGSKPAALGSKPAALGSKPAALGSRPAALGEKTATQRATSAAQGSTAAPAQAAAPKTDEQIVVQAKRRNQVQVLQSGELGALGNMRAIDAPFTIKSYTASLIRDQQSETLGQVLENDPSVRTTDGFGNFSEIFVIRGFPLDSDDVAIDGLYGIAPRQLVSPELYDQVQVLNGANAFLNGAAPGGSGIGGGVNLIMKEAPDTPLLRVTGDYQSSSVGGGAIDMGRRFGPDNAWGIRINTSGRSGDDSIDNQKRDAFVLGVAADYRGENLRVGIDLDYQNEALYDGEPTVIVGSTAVPSPPKPETNYGEPWIYTRLRDAFALLHADYDLTDNIQLYALGGAKDGLELGDYTQLTSLDSATGGTGEAATGAATGYRLYVPTTTDNESVRGGVRIHFDTGPVKHAINVGASGLWEVFRTAYQFGSDFDTNLYNPVTVPPTPTIFSGGSSNDPKPITQTQLSSAYLSDTASFFDDRFLLIAGFRWQEISSTEFEYSGNYESSYDQDAVTPVVGLVFHPTRDTAIYFNRIEGLSQGPTAPTGTINAGEVFPPYTSVQYEVGAKYIAPRISATVAVYQITQPSAYEQLAGGVSTYVENGDQQNRGVELSMSGEPAHGFRLIGGVSVNDAILTNTAGGADNNNGAIGVPTYTLNANAEYDLPFLLGGTVTGRVIRTGPQEVNESNTLSIPGWSRFDLGARYTFTSFHKPVTLRFGVDNITDARYWSSAFNGYLLEGLPRTYKASVSVDF